MTSKWRRAITAAIKKGGGEPVSFEPLRSGHWKVTVRYPNGDTGEHTVSNTPGDANAHRMIEREVRRTIKALPTAAPESDPTDVSLPLWIQRLNGALALIESATQPPCSVPFSAVR